MRTPSARPALLLVTAALVVAAGGCGNTDEPEAPAPAATTSAPEPLSKQEFIQASRAICVRTERELSAFIPLGSDPATRRANRNGIIAVIRDQNDDLRALGDPAGAPPGVFEQVHRDVAAVLERAAADGTTDIEREIDEALSPHGDVLGEYTPDC